jgi:hypothetical protein
MCCILDKQDIRSRLIQMVLLTIDKIVREAWIPRYSGFDFVKVLGRQFDLECFDVRQKMLDFSLSNNWKDVRCFLLDIC